VFFREVDDVYRDDIKISSELGDREYEVYFYKQKPYNIDIAKEMICRGEVALYEASNTVFNMILDPVIAVRMGLRPTALLWGSEPRTGKVAAIDMSIPLIVGLFQELDDEYPYPILIDGNHRIYKAIDEGLPKILIYMLSVEQTRGIVDDEER